LQIGRQQWMSVKIDAIPPHPYYFLGFGGMIPHPSKKNKGGEDAEMVTRYCLGVADGVGGWAEQGIDSGLYSEKLMKESSKRARAVLEHSNPNPPLSNEHFAFDILSFAHLHTDLPGSSTAAIIAMKGNKYYIGNVGDSFITIFRRHPSIAKFEPIYRSIEQFHYFNCPYQLSYSESSDPVSCGQFHVMEAKPYDLILLGTDGVSDNVFHEQICHAVSEVMDSKAERSERTYEAPDEKEVWREKIRALCNHITAWSQQMSTTQTAHTPFTIGARLAGFESEAGGKPYDITAIVALTVPDGW